MFNNTCYNCVPDLGVVPATLLCHCPLDGKSPIGPPTTIQIEPTIQVIDGVLGCFGLHGNRGLTPPAEVLVANTDYQLAARTDLSEKSLDHAAQQLAKKLSLRDDESPRGHCCFYESCSHDIDMRQPEPWLFTRCRRINERRPAPTLMARFDLSKAFMYDRSDWSIKPGEGLYDDGNGCRDCHVEGSWMHCHCVKVDGKFNETSIDLNLHISNINGTLCSSSYCGDHEGPLTPIQGTW